MSGSFDYRLYSIDEYGLSGWNQDVVEDGRGNLYLANEQLLRFDGVRWKVIETPGLFDPHSLAIGDDGRLWVGGSGEVGYVDADDSGEPRFTRLTDWLGGHRFKQVWRTFVVDGVVFFVADNSVLRWEDGAFRIWSFDNGHRLLGFVLEGMLHVHPRGEGLYRYEDGDFVWIADDTALEGKGLIGMHRRSDGRILCLTSRFLYLLDGTEFTRLPTEADTLLEDFFSIASAASESGVIALGSYSEGLLFLDENGNVLGHVTWVFGKKLSIVFSIRATPDGRWIVAFQNGLLHAADFGPQIFDPPDGQDWSRVMDMAQHEGATYVATAGGLFRLHADAPPERILLNGKYQGAWSVISKDGVLIAGIQGGISMQRDGSPVRFVKQGRLLRCYPSRGRNDLLYGSNREKLTRLIQLGDRWEITDVLDVGDWVSSIVELPDGSLLAGTDQTGMHIIRWSDDCGGETRLEPVGFPALEDGFTLVHQSGGRIIVLAQQGLFSAASDDLEFRYHPILGERVGENVYMMDMVGDLRSTGLYVSLQSADPLSRQPSRLGRITSLGDGDLHWEELYLPGLEHAGGVSQLLLEEGEEGLRLWLGGRKRILSYEIDRYRAPELPRGTLASVRAMAPDQLLWSDFGSGWGEFEWDYAKRNLHFEFAVSSTWEKSMRFQSRLIGFEQEWTAPSASASRDITNLPGGRYSLEVRAVDSFGRLGPVSSYSFAIRVPWYLTEAALVAYLITGIMGIALFVRWRTSRLHRQTAALESMVRERTERLEESNRELIEANSVKEDFLARMSHEVRNPLNGILGIVRMLRETGVSADRSPLAVEYLDSCSRHLEHLLNEVLDYSKLTSGRMKPEAKRFDVRCIVEDVLLMHKELAREKKLELSGEMATVTRYWVGDPDFLKQILINLVNNACKYTEAGRVVLRFSYEESGDALDARFEVSDTGPGIPEDERERVFEKFTRLAGSSPNTVPGTGLGLAIVREMVELMGGSIELQSEVGSGSCFIIRLPFGYSSELVQNTVVAETLDRCLEGVRVLVADDLDFNRFVARELFSRLGADVVEAADGTLALRALRREQFDLVLLDINMPGLTGIEAVTQWRADGQHGRHPLFIALSAYVSDEMVANCLSAGFDHFLEKPLDQAALFAILPKSLLKTKTSPSAMELLDYLSDGSAGARDQLRKRYRETLIDLAGAIDESIASQDRPTVLRALHKFQGTANIIPDKTTFEILEQIKETTVHGDWNSSSRAVERLVAHIHQFDTSDATLPASQVMGIS